VATLRIPKNDPVGKNAGLALARYVPLEKDKDEKEKGKIRQQFFKTVAATTADASYKVAFQRWQETMKARKALCLTATLGGPLTIGLGNESPYEVGLTLHRTYGMPLIPGSAIKGACFQAVTSTGQKEAALPLFGTTDNGGYAVFHDAWYIPDSVHGKPLAVDTITVHHPTYYKTGGERFPTDFDDPTPIGFVSVKPGAQFLFAVEVAATDAERSGWVDFTEAMLTYALTELGIGGKTNAGYGWFSDIKVLPRVVVLSPAEQLAKRQAEIDKLDASALGQRAVTLLESADTPELKKLIAQELKNRALRIGRWDKKTEDKAWRKAIEEALL
jgi:CRISPR-associated protein Cmr6